MHTLLGRFSIWYNCKFSLIKSNMTQTLQWFLDREQTFILRNTTEIFIKDEETAKKLYELQDVNKAYTFSEKVRIHRARPVECESCSA